MKARLFLAEKTKCILKIIKYLYKKICVGDVGLSSSPTKRIGATHGTKEFLQMPEQCLTEFL